MAARFVTVDRETQLLLPPDMRQWVPENHLSQFILDAVDEMDTGAAKVNHRGSGSEQYPPAMLLSLLIYSYTSGVFSSRSIERATYDSVATRVLCADTHPDHDTICAFRRENRELLDKAFSTVLEMAARVGVMKVGNVTVAIDGTKILANASKHAAASYEKAGEAMREQGKKPRGKEPKEPESTPGAKDQVNFTDPESRIMPCGGKTNCEQAYNAQAGVEIESRMIVTKRVSQAANDKQELVENVRVIDPVIQSVGTVLIDSGFVSEAAVQEVERAREDGGVVPVVLAAIKREHHHRSVVDLENKDDPPAPGEEASFSEKMAHRVAYNLRRLHGLMTTKTQNITPAWS
ncbi:MAG: transposase [Verrucomicrobiae bacterium]